MTWFRIDDSFYDHPKVADLPDSAVSLWVRAGTYSARHLTDGSVSRRTANRLCDNPGEAIDALLKAGLWIQDGEDAYRFHDWSVYQPTAAEAKATRDARSIGGQIGNHDRWHVRKNKFDPSCTYCRSTDRKTDRVADRLSDRLPDRSSIAPGESGANPPSRPVPSPSVVTQEGSLEVASPPRAGARDYLPDSNLTRRTDEKPADAIAVPMRIMCPRHVGGGRRAGNCDMCAADLGDRRYFCDPDHWEDRDRRSAAAKRDFQAIQAWAATR